MSSEAPFESPDASDESVGGRTVEQAAQAGLISDGVLDQLRRAGLASRVIRTISLGDVDGVDGDPSVVSASLLRALGHAHPGGGASVRVIGTGDPGPSQEERPHDSVEIGALLKRGLISVRTHNRLLTAHVSSTDQAMELRTVGDVRKLTEDQLLSVRGLGGRAIQELRDAGVLGDSPAGTWVPETPQRNVEMHAADDRRVRRDVDVDDHPPSTLGDLARAVQQAVSQGGLEILRLRDAETLDSLAQARGVTRERIRQIESKAQRRVNNVLGSVLPMAMAHWTSLMARAPVSEEELFGPFMDAAADAEEQLQMGRIALRAAIPGVRRARILGERMETYWSAKNAALTASLSEEYVDRVREFAEFGPYRDDDLDEALGHFNLDVALARTVFEGPSSPLVFVPALLGWVRRMAQTRDACFLILERAGRPVSSEVLGRILEVTPRNIAAHLERDDRFRRIFGLKRWALNAWGDLGDGTRYRTTKEAMVDILSADAPLDREELTKRVQAVHPVTSWSVNNWLEDEIFGHFPDGRCGMAFQGAVPYEESEPNRSPEVDPPTDATTIAFHMRVSKDLLRGSGLGIPRYVTWFVGLRRVPSERDFRRDDDTLVVLKRRPGFATISSLRNDAQQLRLSEDCLLRVSLDTVRGTAEFAASCPCHR